MIYNILAEEIYPENQYWYWIFPIQAIFLLISPRTNHLS